jgi:hypothetical protein
VHALSRHGVAATEAIEMFVTWHQVDIDEPQSVSVEGANLHPPRPVGSSGADVGIVVEAGIRRIIAFSSTDSRNSDQGTKANGNWSAR